jgi:hypothetical protein
MKRFWSWTGNHVLRDRRASRVLCLVLVAAAAALVQPSRSAAEEIVLAATFNYTTVNGSVNADGNISGKPIAATTFFDRDFLDLPTNDPDDPLGTARHELFHGIGFARAYNSFFSHLFQKTSGPLTGEIVFNELTNGLGNDLAVITPVGTHIAPGDFTGLGIGGLLQNQNYFLMTPGPIPNAPVPYAIDAVDRSILNAAFNWAGTGGIKINVVFDTTFGGFTAAEMARINLARDNVQAAFGNPTGDNVFTWTVQVPEPSGILLAGLGLVGMISWHWRRRQLAA